MERARPRAQPRPNADGCRAFRRHRKFLDCCARGRARSVPLLLTHYDEKGGRDSRGRWQVRLSGSAGEAGSGHALAQAAWFMEVSFQAEHLLFQEAAGEFDLINSACYFFDFLLPQNSP